MSTHFARPWLHAFKVTERVAPWWSPVQRKVAEHVFRSPIAAHPVLVIDTLHRLPDRGIPHICFCGVSNVGKSTLINALVFGKEIARPSREPGRTRHLFCFDLGQELSLIDLPGYGHAKVAPRLRRDWKLLVQGYLRKTKRLQCVVCLIDAAGGLSSEDIQFWDKVQGAGKRVMVVLTKVDLCHPADLHMNVSEVLAALQPLDKELVWPYIHAVSAEHDLGIRELRASLSVQSISGARVGLETTSDNENVVVRRPTRGRLLRRLKRHNMVKLKWGDPDWSKEMH